MHKLLALLALLLVGANAISIQWTGYAHNDQWATNTNWYPDTVPGPTDDVTIQSGNVIVTIPTGANSITMGTSFNAPANLTFMNNFYIGNGGLNVDGNGNVFLNDGSATITGAATIGGNLYFQSGTLSGQWTITQRGVADLSGAAMKALSSCTFLSQGKLTLGGSITLNGSSTFTVESSATASGNFNIQDGDNSGVMFDTSKGSLTYNGGGTMQIQAPVKIGAFTFIGGNLTILHTMSFIGPLAIPKDSYVSIVGASAVDMSPGVSGEGVLSCAGTSVNIGDMSITGALNFIGGTNTFVGKKNTVSLFTLSGGDAIVGNPVSVDMFNMLSGNVHGQFAITAKNGFLNSKGFDVAAPIIFTGAVNSPAQSLIAFAQGGSMTLNKGAQFNAQGPLTITGTPGETFTNNGDLNVNAPVTFQNIDLAGTGTVNAAGLFQANSMHCTQATIALSGSGVFKGANSVLNIDAVTGTPVVKAMIGAYNLQCPKECDHVTTAATPTTTFTFTL